MKRYFDIGRHYDSVTEGWKYILGDNFHFGYFKTPEDDLDQATDNLIDEMASLCVLKPGTKILDAGCGIGAPAIYLYHKFGSDITGISTSQTGINFANRRIQGEKYHGKVRFMVADMTVTGFPDQSFDVIWAMESSHLIKNKSLLFNEFYRLLNPGGHVLISDVMRGNKFNAIMKLKNISKLINNVKTFGKGKVETPGHYAELLRAAGYKNIFSRNISNNIEGTLNGWMQNIINNRSRLKHLWDEKTIMRFETSIATLKYFFMKKFYSYYLFGAEK